MSVVISGYLCTPGSYGDERRPFSCIFTGSFIMMKISVIYGLLNRRSVILRDLPGIIFFEIRLKHVSEGHFDYYYFISTASGL